MVTPGVKERAMLLGATRPGSAAGELMRYVTQFKMWPTAAMSQMIGREIYMSLSKKEMAANLFTMAALSTAFGYMRMSDQRSWRWATRRAIRSSPDHGTGWPRPGRRARHHGRLPLR